MKEAFVWPIASGSQVNHGEKKRWNGSDVCAEKGKRYPAKLRKKILKHAKENSVSEASEKYDVSENSIYVWRRNEEVKEEVPAELSAVGSEPGGIVTPQQRDEKILGVWRQNKGYGPSQIKNALSRNGFKVSVGTVRNVMEENGYVRPKMKPKTHTGRYEASRPKELYHLDFNHFHVHKQKQCLLFIQDDFSRFIVGWALAEVEAAEPVMVCFEGAVSKYGKPERVMSDRGSAFHSWKGLSRFERMLEDYEINFHLAKEAAVNGKVEALNAAFQKECLRQYEFKDLTDAARIIGCWVDHFNHKRTHHGLGGILVPADRFYGLVERTLKMVELGHGADALDILTPENRGLELFRVISHGGEPQVYLMGKKILGK